MLLYKNCEKVRRTKDQCHLDTWPIDSTGNIGKKRGRTSDISGCLVTFNLMKEQVLGVHSVRFIGRASTPEMKSYRSLILKREKTEF